MRFFSAATQADYPAMPITRRLAPAARLDYYPIRMPCTLGHVKAIIAQ
jgi:hypothetical protein